MEKLILFVGVCVGILSAQIASAESPIWGTYKVECPANSDTYIGITTTRAPVFTGKVQSVQSGTTNIVAQGEPNWSANQFVYVAGSQTNHYYLKFTSGELEGAWYDIKSNGAYFAEIEIGSAELAKVKADDTFQIIPHWTLQTLFPDGEGFIKATTKSTTGITKIYKYTKYENGEIIYPTGSNNAPMAEYYYRERSPYFSWMSASTTVANDDVIEPNAVLFIRQPAKSPASVCVNSVVPMCKTSLLVSNLSETEDTDNYFAVPSMTDIVLSDFNESLIDSGIFVSQTSKSNIGIDNICVYDNHSDLGVLANRAPSHVYFHKNRSGVANWQESGTIVNNATLKSVFTALILRKRCTGEISTQRISFKPNYIK